MGRLREHGSRNRPIGGGVLGVVAVLGTVAVLAAVAGCGGGRSVAAGGERAGGERAGGEMVVGELVVLGASSLAGALTRYAEGFAAAAVKLSFAGSDELAAQLRAGAEADVLAAADTDYPAALHREGLVGRPVVFAANELVIAVPRGSEIGSLGDLAAPGVKLVIGDPGVPVGAYARAVLARLPGAEREAIRANVRSEEPAAGAVVAKLEQGAADAGFVYATDARAADGLEAVSIPAALRPEVAYAAAVVSSSDDKPAAAALVRGLAAGEGQKELRAAGFLPPP